MKLSKRKVAWLIVAVVVLSGLLIPQRVVMPVDGGSRTSYNNKSFWYYPWGRSGTHKGVDIFARKGTAVKAATPGWVVFAGELGVGGNVVLILGPKWRVHYYAHVDKIETSLFAWASSQRRIGTVGDTGNAKGKSPHLHYTIISLIPLPWRIDDSRQGWKKMFYLNPIEYLERRK